MSFQVHGGTGAMGRVNIKAPTDLTVGDLVVIGSTFWGVAAANADSGDMVAVYVGGEYKVPKTAGVAWNDGAAVYWDSAAGEVCTTSTSGHLKIGVAIEGGAAAAATSGYIRLNANFG